ncbi:MAG: D-alanyl-D-alanine carboxypeptidase/D-alanyl-D-alanine-endopeptidase [Rhodanobacter sp.]
MKGSNDVGDNLHHQLSRGARIRRRCRHEAARISEPPDAPARTGLIGDTTNMPASSPLRILSFCLPGLLSVGLVMAPVCRTAGSAPNATAPAELATRIDTLIEQPRFSHASWGIAVVSLDNGRTLYAHRANRLAHPASVTKLFTAAAGLATLGPDYRFTTRALSAGVVRKGRLEGHLILYGTGDPTLGTTGSSDWAAQLAAQLYAHGIRQVQGDLIADDSYFTGPPFGTGWEAGDLQSWFAVPSSALSVDENILELTVTPATSPGAPASVKLAPVSGVGQVRGRIVTTPPSSPSDVNLYRAPGSDTLYEFGSVPTRSPPAHFRLAMVDPALQAGIQLRTALVNRGIRLTGGVKALHWPLDDSGLLTDARVLGELRSPPLLEIVKRGLKRSQNLYLQNLLLAIGARVQASDDRPSRGFRSSERRGIQALRAWLTRMGVDPETCRIVEGTGLSRRNLATPDALVRMLVYLAGQPQAAQWRDALPIAGVDGTLANRMRGSAAAGNVQAKTGSMSDVHSVAGYVTTAGGERLAFAIMLDNYTSPPGSPPPSGDIDDIVELLAGDAHVDRTALTPDRAEAGHGPR